MTLRAAAVVPPIVLPLAPPAICTPPTPLARAAQPAALRPMKLPSTTLFLVPAPSIETPLPPLPELTLRAAAVVPPIVLPLATMLMDTPAPPLAREAEPAA